MDDCSLQPELGLRRQLQPVAEEVKVAATGRDELLLIRGCGDETPKSKDGRAGARPYRNV